MNQSQQFKISELFERYSDGSLSEAEFDELESLLLEDKEARRLFTSLGFEHHEMRQISDRLVQKEIHGDNPSQVRQRGNVRRTAAIVGLAAMLIAAFTWLQVSAPKPIARLLTSELATWAESASPTHKNAELLPGLMHLSSGLATIRFESGAELVLEAPAQLELVTPMKARLLAGTATMEVPEQAVGFVLDTPNSFAVDHGTAFSVTVDPEAGTSTYGVLSGEIAVHHPDASAATHLFTNQATTSSAAGLSELVEIDELGEFSDPKVAPKVPQLRLKGRGANIVKSNKRLWVDRDLLVASLGIYGPKTERRSVIEYLWPARLAELDPSERQVSSSSLRLNLVDYGMGKASHLPPVSTFAVYGIPGPNQLPENWQRKELQWEEIPDYSECQLLGRFEIPRAQSTGSFVISTPELTEFVNQSTSDGIRFIVLRETTGTTYHARAHAFANITHPEVAGPLLELELAR